MSTWQKVLMYTGSFMIGAITAHEGYGWIHQGQFSPRGAIINIFIVIFWVAACHVISALTKRP